MKLVAAILATVVLAACDASSQVNVYSTREEALIRPLLDDFTEQTGIEVHLVTGEEDALLQRLESEDRNSPADVLLTTDAGRLHRAQASGLLQKVESAVLNKSIPANYRDPEGYWYGLSMRARPILYAKDRVDPDELSTYEALANDRWDDKICIRSSSNIYNQSLVASMIAANGKQRTEGWAKGLVENFAQPPNGGDRDQIAAVAAGVCDLAVANTYYFGQMLDDADPAQAEAAQKVAIFWPNQNERGVHVNVSGAGVTAAASHPANAIRLLEFLVSDEAQRWYAEVNHEYPVKRGVPASDRLRAWGDAKVDTINLSRLGELNAEALKLMDRAGWR